MTDNKRNPPPLPGAHPNKALPMTNPGKAVEPTNLGPKSPSALQNDNSRNRSFRLPETIAARFSLVESLRSGGEADTYIVKHKITDELFVLKMYHHGNQPKSEVQELLKGAAERGPGLHKQHVIICHEAEYLEKEERHYELLEYASEGTLHDFTNKLTHPLHDSVLKEILEEINDALCYIHAHNIEHRDLKPSNVLVKVRDPFDLVLTDFSISSALGDASRRLTEIAGTDLYAPPEHSTGTIFRTRCDYWSLGIIMVELITGEIPVASEDNKHVVDIYKLAVYPSDELAEKVTDPHWNKLCRGLLRHKPENRWDGEAVRRWLANPEDPNLTVAKHDDVVKPTFRFLGKAHRTPQELAATIAENWNDAIIEWQAELPRIIRWIRHDLENLQNLAKKVEDHGKQCNGEGEARHANLFFLIHLLHRDRPPSFIGRPLTMDEIVKAANESVNSNSPIKIALGKPDQADWLKSIYYSGVLAIARDLEKVDKSVKALPFLWNSAIEKYRGIKLQHEFPELHGWMSFLLAGSIPKANALTVLRKAAAAAAQATPAALKRRWYQELGSPDEADAAEALLLVSLADVAEAEIKAERGIRAQRNMAMWKSIGFGALISAVWSWLAWALASHFCSTAGNSCNSVNWGQDLGVGGIIVLSAIVFGAVCMLARVHWLTSEVQNG